MARRSMTAFMAYVMEMTQAGIHRQFQRHLTDHDDSYSELHRGIGKTTQMIARCAWEIGKCPGLRIKYVQQSKDEARKTIRAMKTIVESDRFQSVFPDCVPDYDMWSTTQFRVRTKKFQRDATVEACGIFGNAGGRVDRLIADDICDWRNAIRSSTDRENVKDAWVTNWIPMLDPASDFLPLKTWKVGTPYHVDDISAGWRKYHAGEGSLMRLPVRNFISPWAVFDQKLLKSRRAVLGPTAYGRAYELNPISSEVIIFPSEWLDAGLYTRVPDHHRRSGSMIATFDFAFTEKKLNNDPDYSVCLIGWKSDQGHVWAREIVRGRMSFPKFKREALAACRRHGVEFGKGEANGPQKGLIQQMNEDSDFPIGCIDRTTDKVLRATKQQSFVETGRFHIRADPDEMGILAPTEPMQVLYDEMVTFPASGHDDLVDTAVDMMAMSGTSTTDGDVPEFNTVQAALDRW